MNGKGLHVRIKNSLHRIDSHSLKLVLIIYNDMRVHVCLVSGTYIFCAMSDISELQEKEFPSFNYNLDDDVIASSEAGYYNINAALCLNKRRIKGVFGLNMKLIFSSCYWPA